MGNLAVDRARVRRVAWILAACLGGCSSGSAGIPGQESSERVAVPDDSKDPRLSGYTRPSFSFPIPKTQTRFELVRLPGGRLKMDSLEDREVELKPFWIGKHEVTWGEYFLFYACPIEDVDGRSSPSRSPFYPLLWDGPEDYFDFHRPATHLRWHSAMAYCRWLSKRTGHLYRLPTEAEWEYACRGGSDAAAPEPLADYAWYRENAGGDRPRKVGERKPNGFGLHDMLGNVWEYCLEPYRPPDFAPVLRGGGWDSPAADLKATRRETILDRWLRNESPRLPSRWWLDNGVSQGFRLVRVADASDSKERDAYAAKIQITVRDHKEKSIKVGERTEHYFRIRGEVKNAGDRTLDELHLLIHYLDPAGKPYLVEYTFDWPVFTYAFPILAHSAYPGAHRQPLKPGQTRHFEADVPMIVGEDVQPDKFATRVAGLVFAQE